MTKRQFLEKIPFKLLAVFLLLAAGISAGGYFYYLKQRSRAVAHIKTDLATIAQLKSGQIEAWRRERYGDAYVLAESKIFAAYVRRWFANPKDNELKQNIYKRLNAFRIYDPYKEVLLVDLSGRTRIFMGPGENHEISQATKNLISQAVAGKQVLFSDFYYCEKCQEVHLDVIAPLHDGETEAGAVIFRINPDEYLFPLIQTWPTTSKSGETTLLRREGDEIVFLNELRHQKGTAMKLRLPLTDTLLPAAMAALGKEGMVEGLDYRDVPVAAYVKHIPDSPWYLVAKVDKDEIYAPLKQQALSIILVIGLILILLALGLGLLWQGERRGFYKRQYQQELEKRALIRHYDYLTMYANDIILLSDEKYNLIEVNDRACQAYGYRREELLKMKASALRAGETKPQFKDQVEDMVRQGGMVYETVHKRKDGSTFPVESSARPIEIEGKKYIQGIIRDISERKQHELIIQERNQILGTTNRSLDILYRCSLELASLPAGKPVHEVLTGCLKELTGGVAVSFGEYDRGAKEIAVKQILMETTLLSKVEKILGRPLIEVRSPVSPETYALMLSEGAGVRYTLNDITFGAVPKLVSLAVGALLGIDRYLAVVYQTEGQLYGTSVVALKKGQPEPDLAILKAFGSLGAVSLRRAQAEANLQSVHEELQASYQEVEANNQELQAAEEELRKQNDELAVSAEALKKSQEQLNNANRLAHIGAWNWVIETDTVTWSEELYRIAGLDPALPAPTYAEHPKIYAPESWDRLKTAVEKAMSTGEGYQMELELIRPDGTTRWVNTFGGATKDGRGNIIGLFGTVQDITERKQAEEKLEKSHASLQASEAKLQLTLHQAAIGIAAVGLNKRFLNCNKAFCEFIGYSEEELLQKTIADITYPEDIEIGMADLRAIAAGQIKTSNVVKRYVRKDGAVVWGEVRINLLRDGKGQPLYFLPVIQDITERKRAEEALQRSREQYREAQKMGRLGHWTFDPVSREFTGSPEAMRIYGFPDNAVVVPFEDIANCVSKAEVERIVQALFSLVQDGKEFNEEFEICPRNTSETRVLHSVAQMLKGEHGSPNLVSGILQDITERKLAEEALQIEAANLDAIFESSPVSMFILDETTNIVRINAAAILLADSSASDALQHRPGNALRCIHSSKDPRGCGYSKDCKVCNVRNGVEGLIANGGTIHGAELELELIRNGTPQKVWMSVGAETIQLDGRRHVCVAMDDITERKRAGQALIENEKLLRAMADNYPNSYVSIINEDLTVGFTSGQEFKKIGLDPSGFIGMTLEQVFGVNADIVKEHYIETFAGKETSFELFINNQYQTYKTVPLCNQNKKIDKILAVVENITERKQAENALRESEDKYKCLVGNIPEIIFTIDLEGKLTFVSQRIKEILGYDSAETINMNLLNFIPAEDTQRAMETLQKGMKGEKVIHFQTPMVSKSGKRLFCECSFSRIFKNGALIGAQGTASDITERKQAEEKIKAQLSELQRWQGTMLDREDRVMEMKREVNEILARQGLPKKYGG